MRLNEVARVYDGVENDKTAGWFNKAQRAQHRTGGAAPAGQQRRRRRGRDQRALLPTCGRSCRRRVTLHVRIDRSQSIRESVHDVKLTLVLTVVLVVLVIFLFLRNLSATVIPSLALPASHRRRRSR